MECSAVGELQRQGMVASSASMSTCTVQYHHHDRKPSLPPISPPRLPTRPALPNGHALSMSQQQHPWGAPTSRQSTRLAPISTAFAHEQHQQHRSTPSPSAPRPPYSPGFPSLPQAASRLVGSRKSSAASSTSAPFSPAGQQLPASQLLSSSRARTIAPSTASQLASSAAASGAQASSGGGAPRLARASPSLSASSTVGSPSAASNPGAGGPSQNLSRIVIAQIFLLLSQFGPLKDEKDRSKWETQAEQIRKVRDAPVCLQLFAVLC
jgi:CCR4-NOT transcription complex subunit 1